MDAAEHVLDAVRRYLDHTSGRPLEELAAGPVFALGQAVRAVGLSTDYENTVASISTPVVDGDEAAVELDAVQTVSYAAGRRGRLKTLRVDLKGPLRLRLVDGAWKVVDHCHDGRAISESFIELRGEAATVGALSLRLASVELGGRGSVGAFLEVRNDGDGAVKIENATLVAKGCTFSRGGVSRADVAAGERATLLLGWRKSLSLRAPWLRVVVQVKTPRGRMYLGWEVDLVSRSTESSARERRPLRLWLASPRFGHALLAGSFALVYALAGTIPVSMLAVVGAACVYDLAHHRLRRA